MASELKGKGMYVHKVTRCEGGSTAEFVRVAQEAGLSHIIIKVLDGPWPYNLRPYYDSNGALKWADDLLQPFVSAVQAAGIAVWGFQYLYFAQPTLEGARAVERVEQLGLDGMVADAEVECKNHPSETQAYLEALKGRSFPLALSSYRFPELHPEISWQRWCEGVDILMPQVYWEQADNAAAQLARSYEQYRKLSDKVFVPTASAYYTAKWRATPAQVKAFIEAAESLPDVAALNFWEWWYARQMGEVWAVIANEVYESPVVEPETITVNEFVVNVVYPAMVKHWNYAGPRPK